MTSTAIHPGARHFSFPLSSFSFTLPSESWDDDFALHRANDLSNAPILEPNDLRCTLSTSQDSRPDSRSMSTLSQLDSQLPTVRLQEWAEPGPSTLQDTPSPIQKTGMTTLKTRIHPLANLPLDRTTNRPSSQIFLNRRTGTTTWMQTSLCPREKTTPGIRLMTMMASTRRTRPSPPVLAGVPSANTLLPLPCPLSRFRWKPWERHFPAPPPCPFSPFLPPDASLSTHIPHLHISLCAVGTRPPALCYNRARLRRKGAGAYERSRVHLTTPSLSCLTGDGILLPYPRHLNRPHQTRHLSIFLLPKPPTLPDLPSCHVSGRSRGGASVRDLPALAPPILLRVSRPKGTRHPAPPPPALDHHPALQVGFFALRRARLIRLQAVHH